MAPAQSSQNIYDTADFFDQYSKFPRMLKGADGASEWPRLQSMLPALSDRRVLDLGCGDGWFAKYAALQGASRVHGCDISLNMLAKAREGVAFDESVSSRVTFSQMDLEDVSLGKNVFDVVFSGLAMHYVSDLPTLLKRVSQSLAAGGAFIFSIEHPMFTAPIRPGFRNYKTEAASSNSSSSSSSSADKDDGRHDDQAEGEYWPVDSYFTEGDRVVSWLVDGVRKQHRTLGTYMRMLTEAGFEIRGIDEWGGAAQDKGRKHPDWPEGVCPRFLLVAASKQQQQQQGGDVSAVVAATNKAPSSSIIGLRSRVHRSLPLMFAFFTGFVAVPWWLLALVLFSLLGAVFAQTV